MEPDEETIKYWMSAPCICGSSTMTSILPTLHPMGIQFMNAVGKFGPGHYAVETHARTLAIDGLLEAVIQQTKHYQVVNLGAGFDGRFYSSPSLKNTVRLFEMDQPSTQHLKKALVKNCHMTSPSPGGVAFFSLNFSGTDDVYAELLNSKEFDATQPTVFIAEAVFQYMSMQAVFRSLRVLAGVMRRNPASRLIVQSWKSAVTDVSLSNTRVLSDQVLFNFPDDSTKRAAFWKQVGLKHYQSSDTQRVLDSFDKQTAGNAVLDELFDTHTYEYLDILEGL